MRRQRPLPVGRPKWNEKYLRSLNLAWAGACETRGLCKTRPSRETAFVTNKISPLLGARQICKARFTTELTCKLLNIIRIPSIFEELSNATPQGAADPRADRFSRSPTGRLSKREELSEGAQVFNWSQCARIYNEVDLDILTLTPVAEHQLGSDQVVAKSGLFAAAPDPSKSAVAISIANSPLTKSGLVDSV